MKQLFTIAALFITLFISQHTTKAQSLHYIPDSTGGLDAVYYDSGPTKMEFADINDDGNVDILSIGDHGSPGVNTNQGGIMVWFGTQAGTNWSFVQSGGFGYGGITVGDVNNDGKKDVGYAMHHDWSSTDFGDQYIEVALGDGTGIYWTPWDDSLGMEGETWGMNGIDFGDVDNDGYLDLVATSLGCCDGIHVMHNNTNGTWSQTFGFIGGNSSFKIKFGDIDNDGNLDFVACHQNGVAWFGDGTGSFSQKANGMPAQGLVGFTDEALADIDNDGTLELGFISVGALGFVKFIPATQTWQNMTFAGLPTITSCKALALKDMNLDGYVDLVLFTGDSMSVWSGDGGTSWTFNGSASADGPLSIKDVSVADVDHNGFPDVLMKGTYKISLLNNVDKLKLFKETSVATSLNIATVYPKGNECFPNNAARFIEWASTVPQGVNTMVKIELSTTGPTGPWTLVAAAVPNNGRYQWAVPTGVSSPYCHFRLTLTDTIGGASTVGVTPFPFNIGCTTFAGVNNKQKSENNITVIPNPFHNRAQIKLSSDTPSGTLLSLLDLQGRTIQEWKVTDESKLVIDSQNMRAGMYFLRAQFPGNSSRFIKVIIE